MTLFILTLPTTAQIKELNEVKQIPSIDEDNMKIIASSIWTLYDQAVQSPAQTSTMKAINEKVYGYYDTDGDGMLNKVNPKNGKIYSEINSEDLLKNNRLLFNLTFDVNGKLIVPTKIYVISNRQEEKDRTIFTVGLTAFELTITDSLKDELSKVSLRNLAKANINSLTGGLSPVQVIIPFNASRRVNKPEQITGSAIKNGDNIEIALDANYSFREKATELIKTKSDINDYKKGKFTFIIERKTVGYNIDINIMRDMVWSSQPTSFGTEINNILKFEGAGKKLKK